MLVLTYAAVPKVDNVRRLVFLFEMSALFNL